MRDYRLVVASAFTLTAAGVVGLVWMIVWGFRRALA